ncbi:ubiquitin carboxyl-terminal hydrolase CYLD-like [Empidonax traillii]|uniref:ubiquitin carboxyl-terminal hydrolase CYLD-like n=1 Tax=Empidonax traillii TaxID=164674 RepID=UPI000FFD45DE|nr:ubiquitin carboxyl-terminal hydrolase CYLD-like [Empidonax traillii]
MTALPPPSPAGNCFYILTEGCAYGSRHFPAGTLCCCSERSYLWNFCRESPPPTRFLRVIVLDDGSGVTVDVGILQPLREEAAAFLLAIGNPKERLSFFLERLSLEAALGAAPGRNVVVEVDRKFFPGVIRYVGSIYKPSLALLAPVFFGVELQGEGENRGRSDGSYHGTEFFQCRRNCGIFLPFSKIQFNPRPGGNAGNAGNAEPSEAVEEAAPVKVGDAVSFYVDEILTKGIAMAVFREGSRWFVKVCPEEEGTTDIFREIPMDSVVKETLPSPFPSFDSNHLEPPNPAKPEAKESSEEGEGGNSQLEVNSMVQITLDKGSRVSGIIRWVGFLPQIPEKMAGVELDEDKGVTGGEWLGRSYFHCAPKRGLFVRLNSCQPDRRFQSFPSAHLPLLDPGEREALPEAPPESFPPLRDEAAVRVLRGPMRGIQGHCNSCYMDAALFSLFSCTSVLDSMLFMPFPLRGRNVQGILRDEIVNPLRRSGFVRASSVMHLREQLTDKGQCSSFTNAEKDPEEFLNLIMQQILGMEPLLKLQSGGREQDCYCYQIFLEQQEDLVVPNVQQLVERSFLASDLKLVEIPSCFIIQMPRFGKEYKMFSKILPSLELDITDLLLDSPRECCLCGDVATLECLECFKDGVFAATGLKQFCSSCSRQVHSHPRRGGHRPSLLRLPAEFRGWKGGRIPRERLELFAVLCIETSHYVAFVRYGPGPQHWMFFDSMADRHGGESGFNIPAVTLCPEVAKYLELPLAELALEQPREMDGVAKRLFCDAYMYLFQSRKMALYK